MKRPILYCFDIDGTLAEPMQQYEETPERLLALRAHPNVVRLVASALALDNAEVMFCTGRSKNAYGATWRWLNRHLSLARLNKRVTLTCRPPETPLDAIPQFKLSELVQAIRRQPEKLAELRCYDDSVQNLRIFQTLRPMVTKLNLYRIEDGVATAWGT